MYKWNKHRCYIDKFFALSNGQLMKITFIYEKKKNVWFMSAVIGNSKRQINDCIRKTRISPKNYYGKPMGNKLGIEAFKLAKNELLAFEKTLKYETEINIEGANNRLNNIYKYLSRYGYKVHLYENKRTTLMYKKLNKEGTK